MTLRLSKLIAIAALVAVPVGGLLPTAAFSERVPTAPRGAAPAEAMARVIVKYRAEGALMRESIASAGARAMQRPQHAARLAQRLGLPLTDGIVVAPRVQVLKARGLSSAELVARLARDADVEHAEVDQRVRIAGAPNDSFFAAGPALNLAASTGGPVAGQWYLRAPDANLASAINAAGAWNLTTGSASVVVAVLDTGVRPEHPDLIGKLLPGYDFVFEDAPGDFSSANDGDGWDPDPTDPGDWITHAENLSGTLRGCGEGNSSWHGTQVAGLIGAATDNANGIAGTGRNVMLLPVRVLGKCGGYQSDIVAAMRWAAGLSSNPVVNPNPARVINLSLGSVGDCSVQTADTYRSAVAELTAAGVAVVVAAGNDSGFAANQPANCPGAIGVAGVRHSGTKVGYSNIGPELMIAAPAGNCVTAGNTDPCLYPLLTTTNSGAQGPGASTYSDAFAAASIGTSFAAPLVSGTVALMLSARPSATLAEIKAALQASVRPFPTTGAIAGTPSCRAPDSAPQLECYCTTSTCGAGMLDASAAVAQIALPGPVARVTVPIQDWLLGASVSLDGSGSSALGGRTVTSYLWEVVKGGSVAALSGPVNSPTATLAVAAAGTVEARLTVTDSAGSTNAATLRLTVQPPPTAAIAPAAPTVVAGAAVTLDAAASTVAASRSVAAYQWTVVDGAAMVAIDGAATGSTVRLIGRGAGSAVVGLTITDSRGATASVTVPVEVMAAMSGGGGGALGLPWLIALALAALALSRPARRLAGRA